MIRAAANAPAAMVHILAQQLNRGLGAVDLWSRHVEVVNKDDALEPHWGPIGSLPTPVQLVIDDLLYLEGGASGCGHC